MIAAGCCAAVQRSEDERASGPRPASGRPTARSPRRLTPAPASACRTRSCVATAAAQAHGVWA